MPKVRYTYLVTSEGTESSFSEEDIIPKGEKPEAWAKKLLQIWNAKGEDTRKLKSAEVTDYFLHTHDWRIVDSYVRSGGRVYYKCHNCRVTAKGYPDRKPQRDEEFHGDEFEFCREEKPKLKAPTFK